MVPDKIDIEEGNIYELVVGSLEEGLIEGFEEAIAVWRRLGGPEIESYDVPGLPGGPLRLTARTDHGYDFILMNDDVWVSITTSGGGTDPHDVLGVQLLDEALHGCDLDDLEERDLDDLEDAANAIARRFFEDVILLKHAREYAEERFDHTGTSPHSEQDPEDWWAQERRELEEWVWS